SCYDNLVTSFLVFFFLLERAHRYLHSFPTRRSSDLPSLPLAPRAGRGRRRFFGGQRDRIAAHAEAALDFGKRTIPIQRSLGVRRDRKSTRLNSSHSQISYAVFCLKKKKRNNNPTSNI